MMNPLAIVLTVVLGMLMLALPRRFAVIPLILAACLLTIEQEVIVFGFNFTVVRIIILLGWIRVLLRGELSLPGPHRMDVALVVWVLSAIVVYTILWHTAGAFVNRLGHAYDAFGLYFLCRCLLKDLSDLIPAITAIAVMCGVLAMEMLYEYITGTNLFSVFGGVQTEAWIRGSHVRAQGPFRQPILAGCFGATAMPVMVALWFLGGGRRLWASIGIAGSAIIVFSTSSSGPMLACLFGVGALMMWTFRSHLRIIRWSIVGGIGVLALLMKAPIWYLFAKVGAIVGGGGWHRSYLIEQAFAHISEWWLVGTTYTAHWMPYSLDERSADITNQFLVEGVDGGLITMVLFILLVVRGFQGVGAALSGLKDLAASERFVVWSLGASLLGHVISFLSVSYFDQIIVFWYMLLAMIAVAASNGSAVLAAVPAPDVVGSERVAQSLPELALSAGASLKQPSGSTVV